MRYLVKELLISLRLPWLSDVFVCTSLPADPVYVESTFKPPEADLKHIGFDHRQPKLSL